MFKNETHSTIFYNEYSKNWTMLEQKTSYVGLQQKEIRNSSIFFAILYSIMFLFGLFANLLVVFVFLFKKELRQYTNFFFTNLCVADLLVIIVCIPVAISDLLSPDVWNFGFVYCKIYYFIEHCVTTVSSLTIIFISVERYFAISRPLSVKIMFDGKNSMFTIVSIWLVALIVSSPFVLMTEYNSIVEQCWLNLSKIKLLYVLFFNIILIFLPTIGLAILYIYIIINLQKHYRFFNTSNKQTGLRINSKNSIRLRTNIGKNMAGKLSLSEAERLKCQNEEKPGEIIKNKGSKKLVFLWKNKRSRSCSFCFSGTKNNYECRCTKNENFNAKSSNSCKLESAESNNSKLIKNVHTVRHVSPNNEMTENSQTFKPKLTFYNKINFTIVISLITFIFFCCQLPIRIFILWSNFRQYYSPTLFINHSVTDEINFINIISDLTTTIYFFHCISNPIIYNLLSAKFRRAFLTLGFSKSTLVCHFQKKN